MCVSFLNLQKAGLERERDLEKQGSDPESCVLVLVEAPQGVQATERVVSFFPSRPVQTLTLGRLQEALFGDALLPFTSALHGEGLGSQGGQ